MNYSEAIDIYKSLPAASRLDLDRMPALMRLFGNPQDQLQCIHVAGTNGKGSTCAMICEILLQAGYSVGFFNSPHMTKLNESIRIGLEPISDEDFASVFSDVYCACMEIVENGGDCPTPFEIITAMAFLYFKRVSVDFAIIEVGMGGETDATNIISSPLLSIITPIGLDHMEYLGNSLGAIAKVKGGIIKSERPVIIARQNFEAFEVLEGICSEKHAPIYSLQDNQFEIKSSNSSSTTLSLRTKYFLYDNIILGLPGEYQVENAATALTAIKALNDMGFKIGDEDIKDGLMHAHWSGRLQQISADPPIILDCAHNPHGVSAFKKSIEGIWPKKKLTLIIGVLADKDYRDMLSMLLPLANRVIFTEPQNTSRALSAQLLCETAKELGFDDIQYHVEPLPKKALELAIELYNGSPIAIVGSIYLISCFV